MAYKETKAKKYYKRAQANRGGYRSVSSYAGKAGMHIVKQVGISYLKKALGLNTENKNWDQTVAVGTSIPSLLTSQLVPFNGIAQGTTNNQRNGNGIRITHYSFKGALSTIGAVNPAHQRIRIIWTLQRKVTTPGSYVTTAQLLQNPADIDSPYNTDLDNVKVVNDQTIILKPYTAAVAQTAYKFKWNPSYEDGHVTWTDADVGGLQVNQTEGLLQMFIMSDQTLNLPMIRGYGRAHFVDN